MKNLRQRIYRKNVKMMACLAISLLLLAGCKEEQAHKPTAPNIPVSPDWQTSENSNEMGFYASKGISDEFETTEIGNGFFRVNVPVAGGYVLTYKTTLGTFHIVFETSDKALLTIGLHEGDKVEYASIQQAKLKVPTQYIQAHITGPVKVHSMPGDGNSQTWDSFIEELLNFLIELIKDWKPAPTVPVQLPPNVTPQKHECPLLQKAGGNTDEVHIVEMHAPAGTFEFSYETFTAKDDITVEYEGKPLFQTGCVGASGTETLQFEGKSTSITVRVDADCGGGEPNTEWNFTVDCPKQYAITFSARDFQLIDNLQFGHAFVQFEDPLTPLPQYFGFTPNQLNAATAFCQNVPAQVVDTVEDGAINFRVVLSRDEYNHALSAAKNWSGDYNLCHRNCVHYIISIAQSIRRLNVPVYSGWTRGVTSETPFYYVLDLSLANPQIAR